VTRDDIIKRISRPAIIFEVGGFKPDEEMKSSWIGKVLVCEQGEIWPESNGEPMIPLCQINLTDLPYIPEKLRDIQLIPVFIDSNEIPSNDEKNGDLWCLRAYKSLNNLVQIDTPDYNSHIKPFQLRPKFIEYDYPCWEDCPIEIPEEFQDDYYDLFENQTGIMVGGWPSLVQSEIFWAPWNNHSANPEYVFQIDSVEKANWYWGDSGTGYFGRGTANGHQDEWTFSWQCY
jgi:uncharacterized protein YwqG